MLRPVALFAVTAIASHAAFAGEAEVPSGGLSVLVGPSYYTEDGPERLRISARGEIGLAANDTVGLNLVIPVNLASSASDGFGWSASRTLVEVVPSARLLVGPASVVRGYGDLGVGPWLQTSRVDTVFGGVQAQRSGVLTTAALGLEVGKPEAENIKFIVEPLRVRTYFVEGDDKLRAELGGMLGVGIAL